MTGLFKTMFTDEEIHILIIGHEGAGKTTFLEQLKYMYAREIQNNNTNTTSVNKQDMAESDSNISRNSINTLPHPAEPSTLLTKRIRPTIGVNLVRLTHYFEHKGGQTANSTQPKNVDAMHNDDNDKLQNEKTKSNASEHHVEVDYNSETICANKANHVKENVEESNQRKETKIVSATNIANPYAGRSEKTHLLLWDVGGAQTLRSLWAPYFPQCHGVIYIIDSTLPFTLLNAHLQNDVRRSNNSSNTKYMANSATAPETNSLDAERHDVVVEESSETSEEHDANNNKCKAISDPETMKGAKYTPKELWEIYRGNRATLQRLLLHPELESVPFLVLSNKADCSEHVSLSELQDALGVVDWALYDTFYNVHETQEEEANEENSYDGTPLQEQEKEEVDKAANSDHIKQMKSSKSSDKAIKHVSSHDTTTTTSSTTHLTTVPTRHCDNQKHSHDSKEDNINENIRNGYTHSKCGFGKITWKLAEISALSGLGVSTAMDWLVAQLIEHHRQIDDSGDNKNSKHI